MRRSEKQRLKLAARRKDYEAFIQKVSNQSAYRKPGSLKK